MDITTRKASDEEIERAIIGGITFKGGKAAPAAGKGKVDTKAKKKGYVTGAPKKKADIRTRRANRHKG